MKPYSPGLTPPMQCAKLAEKANGVCIGLPDVLTFAMSEGGELGETVGVCLCMCGVCVWRERKTEREGCDCVWRGCESLEAACARVGK